MQACPVDQHLVKLTSGLQHKSCCVVQAHEHHKGLQAHHTPMWLLSRVCCDALSTKAADLWQVGTILAGVPGGHVPTWVHL